VTTKKVTESVKMDEMETSSTGFHRRSCSLPFSAVVAIAAAVEQRNWSCSLWSRRGSKKKNNNNKQLARIGRGGVGDC